jgi:hypothetical protein
MLRREVVPFQNLVFEHDGRSSIIGEPFVGARKNETVSFL